jgi:hypothetical protein
LAKGRERAKAERLKLSEKKHLSEKLLQEKREARDQELQELRDRLARIEQRKKKTVVKRKKQQSEPDSDSDSSVDEGRERIQKRNHKTVGTKDGASQKPRAASSYAAPSSRAPEPQPVRKIAYFV